MATLGKWSGGTVALGNAPETWTAPANLFPTQDRNDSSAYTFTASTSTLTLPSSGLADGYLLIGAFEYEDTSNGRFNPQAKIVQASGTGTFVGGPSGGYNRDSSEDRSYVRCWAFVDGPSASSTYQFQWKADTDDATGGTVRSEFQVIPLYYADIGLYTSASAALYGGTTPNQVTGWSGTDGTNITLTSNVVSVTGDNKRYLILASQFFEGRGGRTQRWHGLEIDGAQENAAKAYSYYRNTSNDETGDIFTWLIETVTATRTIEQTCYRGDGVSNLQGGADIDGSTPGVGDHALVVIELNDSAEVFWTDSSANSVALNGTPPIDLNISPSANFNGDSGSFSRSSDSGVLTAVAMDALLGANISAASNNVSTGSRWTAFAEFTLNGTEDTDSFAGDYLRNNQGSQDTFGWSANLLGFQAPGAEDNLGVSVTELTGTENGGNAVSPAGWSGFWGINLDTLEASSGVSGDLDATDTGDAAAISGEVLVSGSLAGTDSSDTAALSGGVTVQGDLAATDAGDSASLAGAVLVAGDLAATESGADTAALSGGVVVGATLSASDSVDSAAMLGVVPVQGSLSAVDGVDTAVFTGSVGTNDVAPLRLLMGIGQ